VNEHARPTSLFTTMVGVVNLAVALWLSGSSAYRYARYRGDERYRDRAIDEISERTKAELGDQHGPAMPDWVTIRLDRNKIDAGMRAQLWQRVWLSAALAAMLVVTGAGILLRRRWGRTMGLIVGGFLVFSVIGIILGPDVRTPREWAVQWLVGIPLLLILIILNLFGLLGRRARAEFAKPKTPSEDG